MKEKQFMKIAYAVSEMSYCKKRKVGCIFVKDKRILTSGYNGTISGTNNSCEEICDCIGSDKNCKICGGTGVKTSEFTLHAEENAILQAAKFGINIENCEIFITLSPCKRCAKLLAQLKPKAIYYSEKYRDEEGINFLKKINIKIKKIDL